MKKIILITGGLGFLGFNCAKYLKKKYKIILFDNLSRKGSEKNLIQAKKNDFEIIKGDVRNPDDLSRVKKFNTMLHFAAEPSVTVGDKKYREIIDINLNGTINCLELCKKNKANIIFISTSRVYSIRSIENLKYKIQNKKLTIKKNISNIIFDYGITENFPVLGKKSFYGATKLAAEIFVQEYIENFGLKGVINRCSVLGGPGQFGKKDQGIFMYWLKSHLKKKRLHYIGYGGKGYQVRDILHVDDFCNLIYLQIKNFRKINNEIFNVGGGIKNSISLNQLTKICSAITKNKVIIKKIIKKNKNDVKYFVMSNQKLKNKLNWEPKKNIKTILFDTYSWLIKNEY